MTERDSVRFGDTTIEFDVRRSERRKKTVQLTVDGGGVQVAAPAATPDCELRAIVRKRAAWILEPLIIDNAGGGAEALRERRDAAVPGPERANDRRGGRRAMAGGAIRSLAFSNHGACGGWMAMNGTSGFAARLSDGTGFGPARDCRPGVETMVVTGSAGEKSRGY